ncbi:HET-domain-containing protein [Didymella exigua CBS 183.55]|uniref:HET-domain-containing protein n=1 Tax=Didymella exigua CBS 183.55 TaxID=1150837 RepID=A0A6A5S1Y5_9PLEO|nr:HET-domain-containing protein [Didymella exigua CBS 183.55]KAF1934132.1 HET-domain-containing protein [Didymella exigua CBS 183.55]
MHLLKYGENGELTITSFEENELPLYAILSHTWGADEEEVTFADIVKGGGKAKPGYKKIRLCGEQAQQDGLEYFWIDTCCINKANKAEHSLAIRSMFRWYRNAARCYVYFQQEPESELQKSRWFTRGWTLQELLAPPTVEFFSKEGIKLGDKLLLTEELRKATGIPDSALYGTPLSDFDVHERISWSEHRTTTIPADSAYSLMGILGVSLSPIDGESPAEAMKRVIDEVDKQIHCVRDLRLTNPRDDRKRIEETKGGLLKDSYRWVLDNSTFQQWQQDLDSRLLWVKGDPGKGKTMLLCGIMDELPHLMPKGALLSYFFCQATDSNINSATAVLRGLLYMLVHQQPSLVSHIRKKHNHAGVSLFEDANAWVALTDIFADVLRDVSLSTTYLIIDALDECVTDRPKLLGFIARQSSVSSRVKWIVSSRNSPDIEKELVTAENQTRLSLELNAKSVATAVQIFIERKVCQLAHKKDFKPEMRHAVLQHLTSNANNTFLWVALVCQELERTENWNVLKKLSSLPPGLDALYRRMIDQVIVSDSAEICLQVLASTAVLYRPVTITELFSLVKLLADLINNLESVRKIVSLCGSFLTLQEDTVYFVHQSAKDFLFANAFDEVFPDGTETPHRAIFSQSLAILTRTLHRDMYSLEAPGYFIENVKLSGADLLAVSRYPCVYWIDHLCNSNARFLENSGGDLQGAEELDMFLRKKYLYWLEGLSLCKSVGKGVISMTKLWLLVQKMRDYDGLGQLVEDARRFIMYHKGAIEGFPLQTYASALLFSPTGSLIRQLFQREEPEGFCVRPALSNGWSACLQTLEGHSDYVSSVAFSHDSTRLASADLQLAHMIRGLLVMLKIYCGSLQSIDQCAQLYQADVLV